MIYTTRFNPLTRRYEVREDAGFYYDYETSEECKRAASLLNEGPNRCAMGLPTDTDYRRKVQSLLKALRTIRDEWDTALDRLRDL